MATLCKTCKKPIRFLKTEMGKLIPVDAETCDAADEYFDRERHRTHFQTCRQASEHRRPQAASGKSYNLKTGGRPK
jgi:hypothetical protein